MTATIEPPESVESLNRESLQRGTKHDSRPLWRERFMTRVAARNVAPFRGEIWEDDANVGLAQDSSHGNKPFDINSCIYWKPALQKANDYTTRLIVIQAANQIAKSLICELIARHKIKHDPGHMVLYDQTDAGSTDHMKNRFMPFLKTIPAIASQIQEVIEGSSNGRFEVTTTDIKLPGMILRGRPLNEANTQRITIRYMFIHDAAIPGDNQRNGQIRKARIRLTQYAGQELLVVESQGGTVEDGQPDDFTILMEETDKGELTVACPCCGERQNFTLKGWQVRRPDDFQAKLPLDRINKIIQDYFEKARQAGLQNPDNPVNPVYHPRSALWHAIGMEISWATEELTAALLEERRRICGFRRGDELLAAMGEGLFNARDIMAGTGYECYHCGSFWPDTPAVRDELQKSSGFTPMNPGAEPGKYGFIIPAWICPRIPWGQIMLEKVQADIAARAGNDLPLQEWETKRGAGTYDPRKHMAKVASVTATIDPLLAIPDEMFRAMEVDCQKDRQLSAIKGEDMTGHFWVTAFATDKCGNDVQLWRGYCQSWDEWIAKQKELKIPTANVSVDASFKPDEVKAMAARHAEVVCEACGAPKNEKKFACKCGVGAVYATWTMMRGSDQHSFRWEDGVNREYRIDRPEEATVYAPGGSSKVIKINVLTWSNFRIKNLVNAQRTHLPGAPKMTVLPANSELLSERTRAMETENCTWDNQMDSEVLGGLKKAMWVPIHKENHYKDDVCMHTVRKLQAGLLGRMEAAQSEAQPAG